MVHVSAPYESGQGSCFLDQEFFSDALRRPHWNSRCVCLPRCHFWYIGDFPGRDSGPHFQGCVRDLERFSNIDWRWSAYHLFCRESGLQQEDCSDEDCKQGGSNNASLFHTSFKTWELSSRSRCIGLWTSTLLHNFPEGLVVNGVKGFSQVNEVHE